VEVWLIWKLDFCESSTVVKAPLLRKLVCCESLTVVQASLLWKLDCCESDTFVQASLFCKLHFCRNYLDGCKSSIVVGWLLWKLVCRESLSVLEARLTRKLKIIWVFQRLVSIMLYVQLSQWTNLTILELPTLNFSIQNLFESKYWRYLNIGLL
jgi:hypothetical protein